MIISTEHVLSNVKRTVDSFDILRKELRKSCSNEVIFALEDFGDNLKTMLNTIVEHQEYLRLTYKDLERIESLLIK